MDWIPIWSIAAIDENIESGEEEERENHLLERESYIQHVCLEKGLVLCLLRLTICQRSYA